MKHTGLYICASLFLNLPIHSATATVITFNALAPGTEVTSQYTGLGLQISLIGVTAGPITIATVDGGGSYANTHGSAGNLLVPGTDPDDEIRDVRFRFSTPVDFFSVALFDAEESFTLNGLLGGAPVAAAPLTVQLGSFPNLIPTSQFGVGLVKRISLGTIGSGQLFDEIILDLTNGVGTSTPQSVTSGGPEYFDDVAFNPIARSVPAPGSLALLSLGLACIALCRGRSSAPS